MVNWGIVTADHILQAIAKHKSSTDNCPDTKNTFLWYKGIKCPAKHIRKLAYDIATSGNIKKHEVEGGRDTYNFFTKRGFFIEYLPNGGFNEINWRSLEVALQQIRLNYIKWLFYFQPPNGEIGNLGNRGSFKVFNSHNGQAFTLSPSGLGSIYLGGGVGSASIKEESFIKNAPDELIEETVDIECALSKMDKKIKSVCLLELANRNYNIIWKILQNYFWLKLGIHEHVFDICFLNCYEEDFKNSENVRELIINSMRCSKLMNDKVLYGFNKNDVADLVRYKISWNKYAMCSFDTGPIATGRYGFVEYSAAKKIKSKLHTLKYEKSEGYYKNRAVDVMSELYKFRVLYHKPPILNSTEIGQFKKNKDEIVNLIERTQLNLNKIIKDERLNILDCNFFPS